MTQPQCKCGVPMELLRNDEAEGTLYYTCPHVTPNNIDKHYIIYAVPASNDEPSFLEILLFAAMLGGVLILTWAAVAIALLL